MTTLRADQASVTPIYAPTGVALTLAFRLPSPSDPAPALDAARLTAYHRTTGKEVVRDEPCVVTDADAREVSFTFAADETLDPGDVDVFVDATDADGTRRYPRPGEASAQRVTFRGDTRQNEKDALTASAEAAAAEAQAAAAARTQTVAAAAAVATHAAAADAARQTAQLYAQEVAGFSAGAGPIAPTFTDLARRTTVHLDVGVAGDYTGRVNAAGTGTDCRAAIQSWLDLHSSFDGGTYFGYLARRTWVATLPPGHYYVSAPLSGPSLRARPGVRFDFSNATLVFEKPATADPNWCAVECFGTASGADVGRMYPDPEGDWPDDGTHYDAVRLWESDGGSTVDRGGDHEIRGFRGAGLRNCGSWNPVVGDLTINECAHAVISTRIGTFFAGHERLRDAAVESENVSTAFWGGVVRATNIHNRAILVGTAGDAPDPNAFDPARPGHNTQFVLQGLYAENICGTVGEFYHNVYPWLGRVAVEEVGNANLNAGGAGAGKAFIFDTCHGAYVGPVKYSQSYVTGPTSGRERTLWDRNGDVEGYRPTFSRLLEFNNCPGHYAGPFASGGPAAADISPVYADGHVGLVVGLPEVGLPLTGNYVGGRHTGAVVGATVLGGKLRAPLQVGNRLVWAGADGRLRTAPSAVVPTADGEGATLPQALAGSVTHDAGTVPAGGGSNFNVAVPGAAVGMPALAWPETAVSAQLLVNAAVVAAGTVHVVYKNLHGTDGEFVGNVTWQARALHL